MNLHGRFTRFQGAFTKDFGLRDQIRRASVSIMSNIAEGFERVGKGEFLQIPGVAKGSSGEVRAQLYLLSIKIILTRIHLKPYLQSQLRLAVCLVDS